jgi:hypothetical protein
MNPGPRYAIRSLKRLDFVVALQCQRDLVEPLQQAFAPPWINLEGVPLSGRRDDRLCLEVDAHSSGALGRFNFGCKGVDDLLVDHDWENPVLKAIGEEDVTESRTDDGADTQFL